MQVGHDKAEVVTWQACFFFFKRKFIPRQYSHFWDFGDESHESVNHFGKSVLISRLKTTICYLFCIILLKYTFKYHLHVTDHVTSDLFCLLKSHDSRNLDRSTLVKGKVYTLRDT